MYTTLPLFCGVWYPARLSSARSDTLQGLVPCLDVPSTHDPSTRSLFFQSRHSYRPAEGRVEAKRRQRPGRPRRPRLLIGGARWRSMGELRLGGSVTWSVCRWTYRQCSAGSVTPQDFVLWGIRPRWQIKTPQNQMKKFESFPFSLKGHFAKIVCMYKLCYPSHIGSMLKESPI